MTRQDPRRDPTPPDPNRALQDRTIRHLLFLQRVSTEEATQILGFLDDDVIPDLESQLRDRLARVEDRGFDLGPATTERVREMLQVARDITREGVAETRSRTVERVLDVANSEAEWQQGVVNDVLRATLDTNMPGTRQLRSAVLNRPFDGQPLSDWFQRLNRGAQQQLERAVRQGIVQGETVDQIVRRVRGTRAARFQDGVFGRFRRQTEAIVRSGVMHASTQAREVFFEENDDLIDREQVVATLDTRTCPTCQDLDGRTFRRREGPRPPFHVNCRCAMVPVLRPADEVGIDLSGVPEGTRASMHGQVPESLTYNEWLRQQVDQGNMDVVSEALGARRARLFADGNLSVSDFVDQRGRQFPLEELRRRERSAFEAAGISV